MNLFRISFKNIRNRPLNAALTWIMLTMGVALASMLILVGGALDSSFKKNIRGIDMVVGAKGSPLQLILSAVYQIDNPTGNIDLEEARKLAKHPLIDKTIELSYGDSYKGRRIIGTSPAYLELYEAELREGKIWNKPFQAVVGSQVAMETQLEPGEKFFSAHGVDAEGMAHEDHPFYVTGILEETGTVVDKLIFTDPRSIWEVHSHEGDSVNKEITAMLVRFKNKMGMISLPRHVNEQTSMQAALPSIEVNRLFELFSLGISTLQIVAISVLILGAISIFVSMVNSLRDRAYEMALIRSMGASRFQVFSMIILEALTLGMLGVLTGIFFSHLGVYLLNNLASQQFGIQIDFLSLSNGEWVIAGATILLALVAALLPAIKTTRIDVSKTLSEHA